MLKKKRNPIRFFLVFFMFLFSLTVFDGSGISLAIKGVAPFLAISLLVPFCEFYSLSHSAVVGLLCGAVADSISVNSYCYNTIALFLLAVLANLLAQWVFNRNLKASIALCFLLSCAYYLFYWLFFIAFSLEFSDNLRYLLQSALPSAVYTAVLSAPFYYIFRRVKNKFE